MPRGQRIALLAVAALIAVVAFVALRPSDDNDETAAINPGERTGEQAPSAASTENPETSSTPTEPSTPKPPLLRAGAERTLSFERGDTVRFRVRHPSAEEVHVHGYDISKEVPADRTVTLSFPADLEGIFEIELEQSGTPLGRLQVQP
jgi:hypothetical protein